MIFTAAEVSNHMDKTGLSRFIKPVAEKPNVLGTTLYEPICDEIDFTPLKSGLIEDAVFNAARACFVQVGSDSRADLVDLITSGALKGDHLLLIARGLDHLLAQWLRNQSARDFTLASPSSAGWLSGERFTVIHKDFTICVVVAPPGAQPSLLLSANAPIPIHLEVSDSPSGCTLMSFHIDTSKAVHITWNPAH